MPFQLFLIIIFLSVILSYFRYSSDDTDDDTSASAKSKKKKAPLNTRRQTLANPMPPPATAPIASTFTAKNTAKKRIPRNLQAADSEDLDVNNVVPVIHTPTKPEKTFAKSTKPSNDNNDGLETGSDSDAVEEVPPSPPIIVTKFGGGTTKIYNDRAPLTAADVNSPKSYETNWRRTLRESHDTNTRTSSSTSTPKNERYSVNLPKSSTILDSARNDLLSSSKDSSKKDDILSNYDTPYLSEFTRRLSVQASVNLPSLSKTSLKGNYCSQTVLNYNDQI